jgi:hypothetical protein
MVKTRTVTTVVGQHSWGGAAVDEDGAAVTQTWIDIPFKWSDVPVIIEIEEAVKRGGSRGGLTKYFGMDDEKKKKVIQVICKIKGIEYKETKEVKDQIKITAKDIELLIQEFRKYVKVEVKENE